MDRPATEYGYLLPDLDVRRDAAGLRAYPARGRSRRSRRPRTRRRRWSASPDVAWNAGIFLWRRRAIRAALERYTSLVALLEPAATSEPELAAAYDAILSPRSIDHAVMQDAAAATGGSSWPAWTSAGTISAAGPRSSARSACRGTGVVIQANEPADGGRRRPGRGAGRAGGSIVVGRSAGYPRHHAGGAAPGRCRRTPRRRGAHRPRDPLGGSFVTDAHVPTRIVFGTDGWRARIAEDFTFENVRRCADGVARYVVERGEQGRGVVIAYDRRFASEHFAVAAAEVLLARRHQGHLRGSRRADPDELVRGPRAGCRRPASSSPRATTRGPTTASR